MMTTVFRGAASILQILRHKAVMMFAVLALVAGCKDVLYSELTEADANEMVALLVLSGVPASREKDAAGTYAVMVEETDIALAVTVLRNSGLPREKFDTLGDVFGDTGVVGTPFEERIRFAYATNQELANTITQIKGVDSARVHVVIPAEERFRTVTEPARASIAVFHDRTFEPSEYMSRIKTLVAFAVPGLELEDISLTFFLSPGFVVEPSLPAANPDGGTAVAGASTATPYGLGSWGIPLFGLAFILVAVILVRALTLSVRWGIGLMVGNRNA